MSAKGTAWWTRFSSWVPRLLGSIFGRIFIAFMVVFAVFTITGMNCDKVSVYPEFFQNTWIVAAIIVSILITGSVYGFVLFRVSRNKTDNPKLSTWLVVALPLSIVIALGIAGLIVGLIFDLHGWVYHVAAISISILVFWSDWILMRTSYFRKLEESWKGTLYPLNMAIVVGTVSVYIISVVTVDGIWSRNFDPQIISGYAAGAVGFQLIIANMLTDISLYELNSSGTVKEG